MALSDDTVLEPDVLVARVEDFTERDLPTAPLLAVEVLSPSTRRYDLLLERSRHEAAGTRSYWVVDPDEPSIIAWELRDGAYAEAGRAAGAEALDITRPYPVASFPASSTPRAEGSFPAGAAAHPRERRRVLGQLERAHRRQPGRRRTAPRRAEVAGHAGQER